jgi:hypothetical protein
MKKRQEGGQLLLNQLKMKMMGLMEIVALGSLEAQ